MALSWNEIKKRALAFSQEWSDESRENAEKQTFWNQFFDIFGISRRRVAVFEEPVQKLGDKRGSIDLFWKGTLLVEHKSKGKDLDTAYSQALDYFANLEEYELPKYVIVSDFSKFRLYDLDEKTQHEFLIKDLYKNIRLFGFIAGYRKKEFKDQDPVNIKAAELMGKLHDQLAASGYTGHDLELLLVRLLFCLFADDSGIFEKNTFCDYIERKTNVDGSDLGSQIATLFQVLNTPEEKRPATLDEDLAQFRYIDGSLFERSLPVAFFNSEMRKTLLSSCYFDWNNISPAIFGSLFQSVMDPEKRRNIGAHYTSEKNIQKLIRPLFLDDLYAEFEKTKKDKKKLQEFHSKIASLRFFDPACGCGNFLIITYRELRQLEIEVLKILYKNRELDVSILSKIDVDSMYGIEIEEFPAKIAQVGLWLMDHIMNQKLSEEFGQSFVRLPLRNTAKIVIGNALRINWEDIVKKKDLSYILGNPPFVGKQFRSQDQSDDMDMIFNGIKGYGVLDYVTSWYIKAAQFIQGTRIKVAFVSTNSITQGEQVGILWNELYNKYGIKIHFAHRTFQWGSEAKGKAHVFVTIIGFANYDTKEKILYDYETPKSEAHEVRETSINPYLAPGDDFVILKRSKPICDVPEISFGSMPNDDGNFLLTNEEKDKLVKTEPKSKKYIRPLISAREYLNNEKRWCIWLVDIEPGELKQLPEILSRVERVKQYRSESTRETTKELANFPTLFGEIRQPKSSYIVIPRVSSENRRYIPFSIYDKSFIASDSCVVVENATLNHLGVLSSIMHMTWVRFVCGRLKGDYRYSNDIVYNNFPWPEKPTKEQIKRVEDKTKSIIEIRKEFMDSSLADLYSPITMPPKLLKAHQELDKAVDSCYRKTPFGSDLVRIEYLFSLYKQYTEPLLGKKGKKW